MEKNEGSAVDGAGGVRVDRPVRRNSKARELLKEKYPYLFGLTDQELTSTITKYPPGVFDAMCFDAALNEIERLLRA